MMWLRGPKVELQPYAKGLSAVRLISRFKVGAMAALISIACGGIAMAQEQAPEGAAQNFGPRKGAQVPGAAGGDEGPKAETVATHGSWLVQCANAPAAQEGQPAGKACGMLQNAKSEKNEKVGISVIVSRLKGADGAKTVMRVLVPIGVYLPTGIPVEIDGAALPNRLVFTRCTPRICEAFGEPSQESLSKFLKGNDSIFFLYDRPGNGYPLKISLTGFAAGLQELDKQQ
jgi:invasion protein IalB